MDDFPEILEEAARLLEAGDAVTREQLVDMVRRLKAELFCASANLASERGRAEMFRAMHGSALAALPGAMDAAALRATEAALRLQRPM